MVTLGDARRVVSRFNEDQGFMLAAALSFMLLLCLAPLALILFSIAGFLMESDEIAEHLFDAAMLLFPAYGYELAEFLTVLARERLVTGFLGLASWALFATQLFSLGRTVLNRAFRVPVRRPFLNGFVVDLLAVTIVGTLAVAFAVAIIVAVALGDVAARLIPGAPLTAEALRRLLALPLMYAAGFGLVFFVYRALPNTPVPVRASAVTLPASAFPSFTKPSIPCRGVMTTSAVSPPWTRFTIAPKLAYVIASLCPVARSNFGPRSSMTSRIPLALNTLISAAWVGCAPAHPTAMTVAAIKATSIKRPWNIFFFITFSFRVSVNSFQWQGLCQ